MKTLTTLLISATLITSACTPKPDQKVEEKAEHKVEKKSEEKVEEKAEKKTEVSYKAVPNWLQLPDGIDIMGNSHGDIDIDSKGNIYVSINGDPKNPDDLKGIQVYSPDGKYLRNVKGAPTTLHGFVLKKGEDGDFLYVSVLGTDKVGTAKVIKMELDGTVLLTIDGHATVPDKFKGGKDGNVLKFTAVDVGPNGDIYVVDGYGRDFIHRYDKDGKYLTSFGGREEPYNFKTCHKIHIDPRFEPNRILCVDRANNRLVHLDLDGKFIGVVAEGLLFPAGAAFHKDLVAVGELEGRVAVFDKDGKLVAELGKNVVKEEIKTNKIKPENWRPGVCNASHGVIFDADGNVYETEYSLYGRVIRFDKQ